jgi:hypothetical protein
MLTEAPVESFDIGKEDDPCCVEILAGLAGVEGCIIWIFCSVWGNKCSLPCVATIDLINSTLFRLENDLWLKMAANVSFKDTIAAISGGIAAVFVVEAIIDEQDFPIIALAILSKQNISASAVPSEAVKVSLYLAKKGRHES